MKCYGFLQSYAWLLYPILPRGSCCSDPTSNACSHFSPIWDLDVRLGGFDRLHCGNRH